MSEVTRILEAIEDGGIDRRVRRRSRIETEGQLIAIRIGGLVVKGR